MVAIVDPIFDWLVDGAPGANGPEAVVERLAPWLRACGVPVVRVAAFVRTLHPHIMGRSFVWRLGAPSVEVQSAPYAILQTAAFRMSPVGRVVATGEELRRRLAGSEELESEELVSFRRDGLTDYVVAPLRFLDGQVHAITFATDAPKGFTDDALAAIRRIGRPLSRLAEILALRRTATNLLNAYVGRGAGERILQGRVQRGDTESVRCVIWFSDLRGFTTLSAQSAPQSIIIVLNRIFDCQVPFIEAGGGEVLKFMGDGLLAIFPISEDAADAASRAVDAARRALDALDALNTERAATIDGPKLDFGIALHVGEVAYGNIGGTGRLDFTCIGAAVNVASRIEGLTGKLGKRLLLSEDLARLVPGATRSAGSFELKGIPEPTTVHEPVA